MKKIILLSILTLSLSSCETSVEAEKIGGEWLMEGSRLGKGYMIGDQKDSDLAKKFMDAYEDMDAQLMVDLSADTVKFHPADIGGVFDVDMTNTDFQSSVKNDMIFYRENKNKLTGILTFHVLAGKVMSSDISGTIEAATVNGQKVTVKKSYGNVFVNDAQVVAADIEADNGVIHVINKVLIPE